MGQLVNPFRKYKCPACGEEFYPGDCAIVSSIDKSEIRGPRANIFSRTYVPLLKGSKYVKKLALRECPNPKCKRLLPYNIPDVESYTIAIVGDSSSGKSHYIASCIHQLKQYQALQVIGCSSITGLRDTDERYFRNYYEPIYRIRKKLDLTPRAMPGSLIEPLIYELVFQERSALQPAKSINLLFYDTSGEDMDDERRMVEYSHFILNASAIIFLADPLAMPGIVKVLPNHLQPPVIRERSTVEVFDRVMGTFRRHKGVGLGKKLDTPVAITVSKSDLLQFAVKGTHRPLFLSDSVYYNQLDIPKFDFISNEVQTLLQAMGDRVLLKAVDQFEDVSFFAVSATGWPPDPNGEFPPLEPLRCLDPLLWSLWKLGIINVG